jgi:hypothetical protein
VCPKTGLAPTVRPVSILVYVSADPSVPYGDSWELVGTLDRGTPTINQRAANSLQQSSRGSASFSAEFYVSGDRSAGWVESAAEGQAFGIAFDLFGDGSRVLVANKPAKVAALATRPPEPHPGLRVRPVMIPVKLSGGVTRV